MNKLQRQLLWNLYRALRSPRLHRENFNLSSWTGDEPPEKSTLECGSTACAVGLGCLLPSWKKEGFRLSIGGTPFFRCLQGWDAVRHGLGLSHRDAEYLFYAGDYDMEDESNPLAVAERIKKFLQDNA